ncbi:MAG TPA: carbonic anhydrase family protein [Herpetosiphonaceae bacterium]|nr:carbonic anhydrase family protein [Herpetosiphonaceae bacterium]
MSKTIARCILVGIVLTFGLVAPVRRVRADDHHWTYEGAEGPEHWGELTPDYALCSAGQEQSPVDISASAPLNAANIASSYDPSAVNIFNNGHTVQVNYDPGSTMTLEGGEYQLVQFHFHAHSEHTHAGQAAPLEMHLVHKNAEGKLAVVGVWLEPGAENAAFAPVFDHLPATAGDPQAVPGATVDADDLLPAERAYYRYNGSLTTPPCTEGVKWVMLDRSVAISQGQIDAFTGLFANDFRPTQSLNSRTFLGGKTDAAPLPGTGAAAGQPVYLLALGAILLLAGLVVRRGRGVGSRETGNGK